MPRTTAKMVELDYLHRAANPLGARLACLLRWTVADAVGCEHGRAVSAADGKAIQLDPSIARDANNLPGTADRSAVAFARKLSTEGHAITDDEVAELLKHFSPAQVTAIVHTVAYANFEFRIWFALGVKGETPIVPPVSARFDSDGWKPTTPARPSWEELKQIKNGGLTVRVEWGKSGPDELHSSLAKQKERKLRIPLPDKSALESLPLREREAAGRILWNTVSAGYQPEMTRAWFACLYAFYDEAKPNRVFTNSIFWVVTRTNDCFY